MSPLFACFLLSESRLLCRDSGDPLGSDVNPLLPCLQPYMKMAEDDKKRYQDELAGNQVGGDDDEGDEDEGDS